MPTLQHEHALRAAGHARIAGIDEAGRGAWAGPVVAAAVVIGHDPAVARALTKAGANDSKQLAPRQREALRALIEARVVAWSVGIGSHAEIDTLGILPATRLAMRRAIEGLHPAADALIIDAVRLPGLAMPQRVFNFADAISLSVAAASIIAKTERDRMMVAFDALWPGYGYARHKGYGTRAHQAAVRALGPCPIHRCSFRPIAALLATPLL